jgi:uncharacterized membrane protein YebE (DUF533 family)
VYLALAAVGWADGRLTREAADAIVRTALEEGLDLEDIAAIEDATKQPVELGEIDRMKMSKADRLYVYAVASWIATLDGSLSARSKDALEKLGNALGLPDAPRARADEIMREVSARTDRPDRFDLLSLRRTLDQRLRDARRLRMEQVLQSITADAAAKNDED